MNRYPRLDGDWDDLVIVWGLSAWDGPWLGSHALAVALAERHPVLYVDPPVSVYRLARNGDLAQTMREPRLELIRPGLARLRLPMPPGRARRVSRRLTHALLVRSVRRALDALGGSVLAVLSGRAAEQPFGFSGERFRIFCATDDFSAGAALAGRAMSGLRRDELASATLADLITCVSPRLVDTWRARGFEPVLIPNGCDAELLMTARDVARPTDIELPAPIIGVSGQLSQRTDLALLEAVADRGWSLLLVGRLRDDLAVEELRPLLARPNVQWTGPKPYAEVPGYLGAMDVGLVPYTIDEFNMASFPLKTLEYLAAGLPVVATDLPAIRWLDTDLVRIASGADAFNAEIEAAVATARDPAEVARRQAFAEQHSWRSRAAAYDEALLSLEAAGVGRR